MARIKYTLSKFNADNAAQGALCAVVSSSVNATTIYNINSDGSTNANFTGAGICKYIVPNRFLITISGVVYEFDQDGNGKTDTSSNGKKLKIAVVESSISSEGNVVTSNASTSVTVGSRGGNTTYIPSTTYNDSETNTCIIDSLNARDQFAINALRELLYHVPDPSVLSDNEMNFYCDKAYKWAANMMKMSANARSSYNYNGVNPSDATQANINSDELSSTSEKLLNNLIVALNRTDVAESVTSGGQTTTIYSERVSIPDLITKLEDYVKNGNTTVGLIDLIKAINDSTSGAKSAYNALTDIGTKITAALTSSSTTTSWNGSTSTITRTIISAIDDLKEELKKKNLSVNVTNNVPVPSVTVSAPTVNITANIDKDGTVTQS